MVQWSNCPTQGATSHWRVDGLHKTPRFTGVSHRSSAKLWPVPMPMGLGRRQYHLQPSTTNHVVPRWAKPLDLSNWLAVVDMIFQIVLNFFLSDSDLWLRYIWRSMREVYGLAGSTIWLAGLTYLVPSILANWDQLDMQCDQLIFVDSPRFMFDWNHQWWLLRAPRFVYIICISFWLHVASIYRKLSYYIIVCEVSCVEAIMK